MSAAPVLTAFRKIALDVVSGPAKGISLQFSKPLILIGRGLENDLMIENDTKISRQHVEIRQNNGLITIHNSTEKNSVLVNGKIIRTVVIDAQTRILIGDSEILLRLDGSPRKSTGPVAGSAAPVFGSAAPSSNRPPLRVVSAGMPGPSPSLPPRGPRQTGNSRVMFYAIVGVSVLALLWLLTSTNAKKRQVQADIRTEEEVDKQVKLSSDTTADVEKRLQTQGVDQLTYQTAQQQYVRGFRDYRQGQYSRSVHELRAALTYYPQHELARHYLTLAQKRMDEIVRSEMDLGQKYKGQGSYRMCVASFKKVVMLLDDPDDQVSKEAKQYWTECDIEMRERY